MCVMIAEQVPTGAFTDQGNTGWRLTQSSRALWVERIETCAGAFNNIDCLNSSYLTSRSRATKTTFRRPLTLL